MSQRNVERLFFWIGIVIALLFTFLFLWSGWPLSRTIYVQNSVTGTPVVSARLVLHDQPLIKVADGVWRTRFRSRGVLTITAPGYHQQRSEVGSGSQLFQRTLTLRLQPVRLRIHVIDAETGLPLSYVVLYRGENEVLGDSEGRFTLYCLLKGEKMRFTAPGFVPMERVFPAITEDQVWRVALQPRRLTLVVQNTSGRPLPGALVTVSGMATRLTDSQGRSFFDRLSGPTLVTARKRGYYRRQVTLQMGKRDRYTVTLAPINIVISGTLLAGDVSLPVTGTLAGLDAPLKLQGGRAVLAAVLPSRPLTLTVSPVAPAACLTVTIQAMLVAPPPDLPAILGRAVRQRWNDVLLTVQAGGYRSRTFSVADLAAPHTFCLAARQIQGVVRDWNRKPLSGVQIMVGTRRAITGADGHFRLLAIPPEGKVTLSLTGYHTLVLPYRDGDDLQVTLYPHGLDGRLSAPDGQGIPNALVVAGMVTATTAADGSFFLPDVSPGVTVTFHAAGYLAAAWQWSESGLFRRSYGELSGGQATLVRSACPYDACLQVKLQPFTAYGVYLPMRLLYDAKQVNGILDLVSKSKRLNAIVVDIKGDYGHLAWDSPRSAALGVPNKMGKHVGLPWLVTEAHRRGIYLIGRFVTFKDDPLVEAKPELGVKTQDGHLWKDRENLGWANALLPEVRNYTVDLLEEAARLGLDEIQLDYLRFPSDGDLMAIHWSQDFSAATRTAALRAFMSATRERLQPFPIALSADLFGLTIWVAPHHDMGIGQRVDDIAPFVDYVSPMIYPSTFTEKSIGFDWPYFYPYELVGKSVLQGEKRLPPHARLRPWLQAYWYPPEEVQVQRLAAEEEHSAGWIYWNAAGYYSTSTVGELPEKGSLLAAYRKWQEETRRAAGAKTTITP